MLGSASVTCTVLLLLTAADDAHLPWASNHHPTDRTREHVQEIADAHEEYVVVQGGTMDGHNCRSPQGVWQPFEQTWESNRWVRMENVGQSDVVNPWLSNGRNDFGSLDRIAASAIRPGMTDGEKAIALWWQEVQHRFHYEGDNDELLDPVKVFNVYGHNTCGNDSICLAGLWRKAGLRVAPARLVGHCATQVFYDGAWHLLDGDMQSIYLLRDNQTVAGEQDLVHDHDLIRRTHTQGILQPEGRAGDEWESSIYVFEGQVTGDRNSAESSLKMTLRPGEAVVWRWGHLDPVKYHGPHAPRFPERICNGSWEYRPDFSSPGWRAGATTAESVSAFDGRLLPEEGKTGHIVWKMSSPYALVGGRLEADGGGITFQLSWDGQSWHKVDRDLDPFFPSDGPARYGYFLKCELAPGARLGRLAILNDVLMAPLTLPGMRVGTNRFTYADESAERRVRISHGWVERSASRPPAAPAAPVFPPASGEVDGTEIAFRWQSAADPDGDAITDYHFELSIRADMQWPLSMSFAKLISRTADVGQSRYTLPGPGLLNPDTEYFWHVRAKGEQGVWGDWSRTWSFVARGPAAPRDVRLEFDAESKRGTLRWAHSELGRKPVSYRIYASDEKGFSVSDRLYKVTVGTSQSLPTEFAANFVAETSDAELAVVGPDVSLAGANRAFYRVVAVDGAGNHSGPSDYAAAPRPLIASAPVTRARKGTEYRYPVATIRSLGDLRTRVVDGKEIMNFWDIERPRFGIERGPRWLKIDAATGLLSGTPDDSGTSEVVVSVALEHNMRRLDESALKWGVEKVVSSGRESTGKATQSFTIRVDP
ncbi:MAG TPA: hypothetical protein VHC22_09750 [Pirellulales bacterium]|nr:hypothetical protein [Pirellulales bacterium]